MSDVDLDPPFDQVRPLAGIVGGALLGGAIYAAARGVLPAELSVIAVVVGLLSGVGARLVGAIGSPAQLRVLIFATLIITVIGEYVAFATVSGEAGIAPYVGHLLRSPVALVMLIVFTTLGIFAGVRVLVGGDPIGDLAHALEAMPGGQPVCPACGAQELLLEARGHRCQRCDHWVPPT